MQHWSDHDTGSSKSFLPCENQQLTCEEREDVKFILFIGWKLNETLEHWTFSTSEGFRLQAAAASPLSRNDLPTVCNLQLILTLFDSWMQLTTQRRRKAELLRALRTGVTKHSDQNRPNVPYTHFQTTETEEKLQICHTSLTLVIMHF